MNHISVAGRMLLLFKDSERDTWLVKRRKSINLTKSAYMIKAVDLTKYADSFIKLSAKVLRRFKA